MATDYAIGQRRKEAIRRIQKAIAGENDYPLELPKHSQYGQAMLQLKQIETLADYIERAPKAEPQIVEVPVGVIPEKYLRAEQLARENATKKEIIDALLGEEGEAENAAT